MNMTALVLGRTNNGGPVLFASGSFTQASSAAAITLSLGFKPRHFVLYDESSGLRWEKTEGMTAADAWKTNNTGPTSALDTGSHVLFNSGIGVGDGVGNVVLDTTSAPNSAVCSWVAWG